MGNFLCVLSWIATVYFRDTSSKSQVAAYMLKLEVFKSSDT